MKTYILIALMFLSVTYSQTNSDIWYSYYDDSEEPLKGFKDISGNVKISPRFTGFTPAWRFDKIMAATEIVNEKWESYYLLKDGTKFGRDSLFFFDFNFACESEGYIKFQDHKHDKVGMFGPNGKVAIPAVYNAMTKLRNGMAVVLAEAEKVHMKHNHGDCDHWYWDGGTNNLINTNNEVLVENFEPNEAIDYYSLIISPERSSDNTRVSFKGKDGNYYTFIDNEKLFTQFIEQEILPNLTIENLIAHSYPEIIYWSDGNGWISKDSAVLLNANFNLFAEKLRAIRDDANEYHISIESHIVCPDKMDNEFDQLRDNCGQLDTTRYPYIQIYIQPKGEYTNQHSFGFLKTDEGFKLLAVSFGTSLNNRI